MRLLIAGRGRLGKILDRIATSQGIECRLISAGRASLSWPEFSAESFDVVIDCLDPASSDINKYSEVVRRVCEIRRSLTRLCKDKVYMYISSANVYKKCAGLIDENSEIHDISALEERSYIHGKLKTEEWLWRSELGCLRILRPVALWSDDLDSMGKGFFADLAIAKKNNRQLLLYDGDSELISYMNINDAAVQVIWLAKQHRELNGIFNVTANRWATRKRLKGYLHSDQGVMAIGRRIVSSRMEIAPMKDRLIEP